MDNYIPGLLKYAEMSDVMGLFAPKGTVLVAGKEDNIFPIAGVRKAFRHLKRIYKSAGAEDRCHLVVGPEARSFPEPTRSSIKLAPSRIRAPTTTRPVLRTTSTLSPGLEPVSSDWAYVANSLTQNVAIRKMSK
jgi:hypothetical protein